jgi:hypothetical protein
MIKSAFFAFSLVFLGMGCSAPTLTPEQSQALKQAQSRQYEIPFDTVWSSTLSYLQDNYYIVGQANKDGAIITASKLKSKTDPANEIFWVNLKNGEYITLTLFYDRVNAENTKIRVNINTTKDKGSAGVPVGFGSMYTNVDKKLKPVIDPVVCRGFLDNLSGEIQRRWMSQKLAEEARAKVLAEVKAEAEAKAAAEAKAITDARAAAQAKASADALAAAEAKAAAAEAKAAAAEAKAEAEAKLAAEAKAAAEAAVASEAAAKARPSKKGKPRVSSPAAAGAK